MSLCHHRHCCQLSRVCLYVTTAIGVNRDPITHNGRSKQTITNIRGCHFRDLVEKYKPTATFTVFFTFYNCIVKRGFLPWEIRVAFPGESQLRQSRATQITMHAGCFSVSIIHRTLTWSTGSLTCTQNVNLCDCTRVCTDIRKRVCSESRLWEKNPLPHRGTESALAACRSDALPTELHPHPLRSIKSRDRVLNTPQFVSRRRGWGGVNSTEDDSDTAGRLFRLVTHSTVMGLHVNQLPSAAALKASSPSGGGCW